MTLTEQPRVRAFRESLLTLLLLLAALFVLFRQSLFTGKVLSQADALYQFEPWKSHAPPGFQASNPLLLDQSIAFLPWKDFEAEQLRKGSLPLWNPHNYAGQPIVGTYQSAIYSPFSWIYYLWPSWRAQVWIAILKLLLAGYFLYLYLSRIGVEAWAARVGGLGYMFSGFMIAWLGHPHSAVALYLPALLWSVERVLARPVAREAGLFGVFVALQFLAGHVQTSLFVGIAVVLYALWRSVCGAGIRPLLWLGLGGLLGTLLALPQLLPFFEYLGHSQAAKVFEQMETVARGAATPGAWLLVDPWHFGAPQFHNYTGPLGANLNYSELIGGYVGRLLLLCAAFGIYAGLRKGSRATTLFFLLLGLAAGLVAYQVEPFYGWAATVPKLRSTKLLRLSVLLAFALCVLGAKGLQGIRERISMSQFPSVLAFLVVAAEGIFFAQGYNPEVDPATLVPPTRLTEYLRKEQGLYRSVAVDNSVLKPGANLFYRVNLLTGYDSVEDERYAQLLLRCTRKAPRFPFVSTMETMDEPNCLPLLSLLGAKYFLAKGALPVPLRKIHEAEVDVYENPSVKPRAFLTRDFLVEPDAQKRLDRLASAQYQPSTAILEEETSLLRLCQEDPDAIRGTWASKLGPPEAAERDAVRIERYEPREVDLRIDCSKRAMLVLTDVWDPGWSLEVIHPKTGSSLPLKIERVDHALRGAFVEPGRWLLRFRYDPASTRLGLLGTLLASLALITLLLRTRGQAPVPDPTK